jgi:hypothetical protein
MTARPLTPALALAYLRELSTDVRAAVVLDVDGRPLAGDASLADAARPLLAGGRGMRRLPDDAGTLLAARAASGVAIALAAGPRALLTLLEHDLTLVLGDLAGEAAGAPQRGVPEPSTGAPEG